MKRHYHLPTRVQFNGEASEAEKARLERALIAAIRRAVESASAASAKIVTGNGAGAQEDAREHFSLAHYRPDRGTYAVPSYDESGASTEVPVEEIIFEEEEVEPITSTILLHPVGEVAEDRVVPGRSPFEGQLIAIFPGWEAVRVRSDRYAVASDLRRAIRWGQFLFGTRSFVIIEGPFGSPEGRYYVLGTTHAIRGDAGVPGSGFRLEGGHEVFGMAGQIYWGTEFRDDEGHSYLFRALFTVDDRPLFPPNLRLAQEFYTQLALTPPERGAIPAELARSLVFEEIDRLIAGGEIETATRRLAELDAQAFALVDWETKVRYLQVLVDAWTNRREEEAIYEIIKSVGSATEIEAIFDLLRRRDILHQLFADLDGRVYQVLIHLGRYFGEQVTFDSDYLIDILVGVNVIPGTGLLVDPETEILGLANGFKTWILGTVEGLWFIISEPGKFVEALGSLAEFLWLIHKAQPQLLPLPRPGDPEAIAIVNQMMASVGEQIKLAILGAAFADETRRLLARLRYALVFEVLSWFVGIGEIKAAMSAANLSERLAGLARLLRLLGMAGRAGEAAETASKIERLAALLARAVRGVSSADDAIRLFGHLPADDVAALGRVMETVDLEDVRDVAALRRLLRGQRDLADALSRSLENLETLAHVEGRLGSRITQEGAEGLQLLMRRSDLSPSQVRALVDDIADPEHLAEFLFTMRSVGGSGPLPFLRELATSRRAMRFLREVDADTFVRIYLENGSDIRQVERFMDGLEALRTERAMSPAEYRSFLDRLRDGDPAAFEAVGLARVPAGAREALGSLRAIAAEDPAALAGLERLVRGGYHDFFDDLTRFSAANARRRLRVIQEMTDGELEGLNAIRALDHAGGRVDWEDFADLAGDGRRTLLEAVADVHPHTDSGLDQALFEFLEKGGGATVREIQGSLGQLLAARTALRRFPGYRVTFEVPEPGRIIDIRLRGGGPDIDVEVKTNLPGASARARASFVEGEARWDVIQHASDGYENLRYLYHPDVGSGELDRVARRFRELFDNTEIQNAIRARGIDLDAARRAFDEQVEAGLFRFYDLD